MFNAFVARVWLKELVQVRPRISYRSSCASGAPATGHVNFRVCQAVDVVCYLLIMAGISLDAVYLPTSPKKIDVVELSRLFREPAGIMFWVVVLSALMGLQRTQQLSSRLVQCLRSLICSIGCTFPLVRAQS